MAATMEAPQGQETEFPWRFRMLAEHLRVDVRWVAELDRLFFALDGVVQTLQARVDHLEAT
ncbi:MAG TPA: hypothetical protein VF017_16750 [Thermoanaerobaculia bacterium]|nr:hypothetical protein [Thermoanaerobaculia bacterium]